MSHKVGQMDAGAASLWLEQTGCPALDNSLKLGDAIGQCGRRGSKINRNLILCMSWRGAAGICPNQELGSPRDRDQPSQKE